MISHDEVEWFWSLIERAQGDRGELTRALEQMTEEEISRFQDIFLDHAAELQDEPYIDYIDPAESEDGIEDIANWVVSQGPDTYRDVLDSPEHIPSHIDVDDPRNLSSVAYKVYFEKFGRPLELM